MFNVLTGCQAMQQMLVNVSKNNTIHSLLQKQFPAIKSSDNKPAYYLTRNETMILEVLEAQEPAVFRQQLFSTLTTYYEEIQSMSGAGGRPKPKHFKRTMIADEEAAGGGEPIEKAAADAPQPPPPPPAADDAAPDPVATPPPTKGVKGLGGSGGAEAQ